MFIIFNIFNGGALKMLNLVPELQAARDLKDALVNVWFLGEKLLKVKVGLL